MEVGGLATSADLRSLARLPLKYLRIRCDRLAKDALALLPPSLGELTLVIPASLSGLRAAAQCVQQLSLEAVTLTRKMCEELEARPALEYLDVADAETHLCSAELAALGRRMRVVTRGELR